VSANDWTRERRAHFAAERQIIRFIIQLFAKDV
jgi:hypothetical protein